MTTARALVVAATLGCGALLCACGGPSVTSGVVIAKQYSPPSQSHYFIMVGKVPVPETDYNPAQWQIEIKNGANTAWVNVPSGSYPSISVGAYYGEKK